MGLIIFWSVLVLVWIVLLGLAIFDDDNDAGPGRVIFSVVMLIFTGLMLGARIDNYRAKKTFEELLVGQTYIGTFKDDPFTRETITITNLTKKKDVLWVQYRTSKGDTIAAKMIDIVDFFK